MAISFSCSKCSTRFKVPDGLAGKHCRCKKCGQPLQIPSTPPTAEAVAATGVFRMGTVPIEQREQGPTTKTDGIDRADATLSQSLRLAPIASLDNVAPVSEKKSLYWEEEDSVEYELESPIAAIAKPGQFPLSVKSVASHNTTWSKGGPLKILLLGLRKISDFAYVPSMLCLLLLLLAIVIRRHDLAIASTTGVLALNLVRFCINGLVLLTLAFKPGIVAGVLFFIPPFTFYYLSKRGKVLKNALTRFLSPAIPVAAVVLLYIMVPWLRGDESPRPADPPPDSKTSAAQQSVSDDQPAASDPTNARD